MAGKKYSAALAMVDRSKTYSYTEAVALAQKTATTKFDSSVEVSFSLNVDPRQAEQNIRGALVLPNGTGRTQRVLVITQGPKVEEAKAAGADFVGGKEMLEQIQGGWFDFDVIVATPDMMGQLGRLGKLLGPKGLMPNPKTNTVTPNPAKAVEDINKGMVEFRTDSYGNIHGILGKVSFDEKALQENLEYVVKSISKLKPASVKGKFITSISVSTTMGPGIKVDQNSFDI